MGRVLRLVGVLVPALAFLLLAQGSAFAANADLESEAAMATGHDHASPPGERPRSGQINRSSTARSMEGRRATASGSADDPAGRMASRMVVPEIGRAHV